MNKMYFTITGTKYYLGKDFMERDMCVKLIKEKDNKIDKEAIKVELEGLGKVGYVANSVNTVLGDSMSAGRLYDKICDEAYGKVLFVLPYGVICEVINEIEE